MTISLAMKRAVGFSVLVLCIYGLVVMPKSTYGSIQDSSASQLSNSATQRIITPSDAYRHHETLTDVAKSALDYGRINNASLGVRVFNNPAIMHRFAYSPQFGKVFVLSLPNRSDKRDTLVVQASLSNFSVTFIDGIAGATISDKALPYVSSSTVSILQDKAGPDAQSRRSSRETDKQDAGGDIWISQESNTRTRPVHRVDCHTYSIAEWSKKISKLL
jgi:hypothetical protein